jgi:Fatty acid desaturase
MASVAWDYPRTGIWRFSRRDAILVALAALHGVLLVLVVAMAVWPVAPLIAAGVWWNSNTIAHNFVHRPFFRPAALNRLFSAALSVLLGIPQTLWRDRHLAHHARREWRLRVSRHLGIETALVLCLWAALVSLHPRFFLLAYLPGYFAGLALCAMQGYWEHAAGRPTSHYGRIYNFLCFNDGYHAEHHGNAALHWTKLPHRIDIGAATSEWPPLLRWLEVTRWLELTRWLEPLRWLDVGPLEALERLVLRSPRLQRFVLRSHRRAFRSLLPQLGAVRRVTIVGGGLFPRTALLLRELLPAASLTIVDSSARNLETARRFLGGDIEYRNERYMTSDSRDSNSYHSDSRDCHSRDCDLTVIPLCLDGDREAIYRCPPSPAVLVHEWIWRRRGTGAVVSAFLLKRVNLVQDNLVQQNPVRQ